MYLFLPISDDVGVEGTGWLTGRLEDSSVRGTDQGVSIRVFPYRHISEFNGENS